jgi:uncharacterized protein (DUF58 family)
VLNLAQEDFQERQRHRAVERAIEIAASLAVKAAEAGQPVGMITNGRLESGAPPVLPVREGYAHAVTILEILAEIAMRDRPADRNGTASRTAGARGELIQPLAELHRGYGMRLLYVGPPLDEAGLRELVAVWGATEAADLFYIHGLERESERPAYSGYSIHDVQLFGGISHGA